MTAERDSMTLNEVSVPALGVEERSDEACASHLSHPGCIKNADRSAGTGDGTIFAVRRA